MSTTHEIEKKFAVEEWFVLPPLADVDGVAEVTDPVGVELEAVYYDTADLRLARDNVTLRRREGGDDEGWHVKLPAGPDARDEIHRPLTISREVPDDLAELVAAHAGADELRPVARIQTSRIARRLVSPEGQEIAELVDDHVRGQTLGDRTVLSTWRELEIEALSPRAEPVLDSAGDLLRRAGASPAAAPSKLARVLRIAGDLSGLGAPGGGGEPGGDRAAGTAGEPAPVTAATPAGEVVARYLSAQIEALVAADPRVRRDEPESVHDMRVATRRLRATLRAYAPLFDRQRAEALGERLRGLGEILGVPRDAEVQLAHFQADLAAQPPQRVLGPVAARFAERLRGDRLRGREAALDYLRGGDYPRLLDDLRAFAADTAQTPTAARPAGKVLPRLVDKADRTLNRRVERAFAAASPQGRDVAYHQARKAAKRLRYAAEAGQALFGRDAAALAKHGKRTQNLLGEHQDSVVAREVLMTMAIAANLAGESSFTYGLLLGGEEARAERRLAEFGDYWPNASRKVPRRHHHLRLTAR